jgi:hypothetical protein
MARPARLDEFAREAKLAYSFAVCLLETHILAGLRQRPFGLGARTNGDEKSDPYALSGGGSPVHDALLHAAAEYKETGHLRSLFLKRRFPVISKGAPCYLRHHRRIRLQFDPKNTALYEHRSRSLAPL